MQDIIKLIITTLFATKEVNATNWKPKVMFSVILLTVSGLLGACYMVLTATIAEYGNAKTEALAANSELQKAKEEQIKNLQESILVLRDALEDGERLADTYLNNYDDQLKKYNELYRDYNLLVSTNLRLEQSILDLELKLKAKQEELEFYRKLLGNKQVN